MKIMKHTLIIIVLAVTALTMQSCGTKTNEQESESSMSEADTKTSYEEKTALTEKQRIEFIEKIRKTYLALGTETPYYTNSDGVKVFNKAEVEPTYKGGKKAMENYLKDNLNYPVEAKLKGQEGIVIVEFIIADDGSVNNVKASNSTWGNVDELFIQEAVRVVSIMPNWTPGTQHGKPVSVSFNVPINFSIK